MSFLNKFKKEFEGLNIGDRLQAAQPGGQQGPGGGNPHSYSAPPPPSYGYEQPPPSHAYDPRPPSHSPYQSQSQYPPPPPQDPYYQGQHGGSAYGAPSPQPHMQSPPPGPPTYSAYPHSPHQSELSPPPGASPYPHPSHAASAPANVHASGGPCPRPPQWVPHWSEQDRRWYYVETTGRSAWDAPGSLPPLPSMPQYSSGDGSRRHQGHGGHHQGAPSYGGQSYGGQGQAPYAPAIPQAPPPGPGEKSKMPSSNTMLAAAGGFAAGGVVGYFTHDVLDKRKKKKRHGMVPSDFADFAEYPAMMVNLDCNLCDQAISGPYAHCAKCDRGDFDLCRDCLAQGATCDGKGKHRLVKVYPKYTCDYCDQLIKGDFYHCAVCNRGDWDVCQRCLDRGLTCKADGGHNLAKLYIPVPGFKNSGRDASSTSSSD